MGSAGHEATAVYHLNRCRMLSLFQSTGTKNKGSNGCFPESGAFINDSFMGWLVLLDDYEMAVCATLSVLKLKQPV